MDDFYYTIAPPKMTTEQEDATARSHLVPGALIPLF